ncbi:uncharacterized protein LOC142238945 [Haematobia irritans]|uniref:uncharacterized protein LOC142238945 n=1 Tax=Haematobia irritans TaxID=7368 RepID=UPI003F509421
MISNSSLFWKFFGALTLLTLVGNPFAAAVDCSKKPPKINPTTCCTLPHIITDDVMEKCKAALPPPPSTPGQMSQENASGSNESKNHPHPPHHHHHHHHGPHHHHGFPMHPCFMTCALNETGILMATPDAKLNEEKLKTYLNVVLANATEMIPIMENSFKTCAAKGEEMRMKFLEMMEKKHSASSSTEASIAKDRMMRHPHPPPPHHGCSPCADQLMGCVFTDSLVNCPASLWSNTDECNEMREHMKNCKPPMFHGKGNTSNLLDDM